MNVDATMALIAEQAYELFLLKEQLKKVERINRHLNMQNTDLKDKNQNLTDALSNAMNQINETQKEKQKKEKCETSKKLLEETAPKETVDAAEKIRKEKFGVCVSSEANVRGKLVINIANSAFISGFLEGAKYQKEKDDAEIKRCNEFYMAAAKSLDTSTVNRVEVIDSNGRTYVNRDAKNVDVKRQDDFKTLKVFLT